MKKLLMLLVVAATFVGCKTSYPVAQSSGSDDMAYLLFVGQNKYGGKDVVVTIDNVSPFTAKVVKAKDSNRKGTQYGIATGTRDITVTFDGEVIYQKKIFVSTQEVKQIILP